MLLDISFIYHSYLLFDFRSYRKRALSQKEIERKSINEIQLFLIIYSTDVNRIFVTAKFCFLENLRLTPHCISNVSIYYASLNNDSRFSAFFRYVVL